MSKKKRREIPRFNTPIIETHCHLDYLKGDELLHTLEKSRDVGVEKIITIAVSPDNLETVRTLANSADFVWGTQGIHPHEAEHYTAEVESSVRGNLSADPRLLAVGEIGKPQHVHDHCQANGPQRDDRAGQDAIHEVLDHG